MTRKTLLSSLMTGVGFLIALLGLVLVPLPVPLGIVTIAIGLSIIFANSPAIRRRIMSLRWRYPRPFRELGRLLRARRRWRTGRGTGWAFVDESVLRRTSR